ncbi:bifunctional diguanylate cyclase/phosphodiesterase [uncultured Pseudokineococcus sp.]|uniref:putative bifunctional diguanylate cyclase/phosphodiesterase n=1 Tax=uncultured Pseudokineococcus sp. TaxID=1642928 RepID=UPI002621AEAF|nr:bifunctional diguanylate cyclase/phosphodiesterase [uncultured Pseudokineococcus sp.]
MPGCTRPRAETAAAGVVLLVAAGVAVCALFVPALRPALLVGAAWASVAAVAVGVVVHRPARRRAWTAIGLMLTCWAGAQTWSALSPDGVRTAPLEAMVAGQLIGAALVARLFTGPRRCGRLRDHLAPGPLLERALLVAVVVLATAQLVARLGAPAPGAPEVGTSGLGVATAALDVLLLALVLRFVSSRSSLAVSTRLLVLGAVLGLGYHLAGAVVPDGPGPGSPLQAAGAACFVVLGGAALLPSMTRGLDGGPQVGRRAASVQLLGLVPLVGVAPALWLVERASATPGGLPTSAFVGAGAVIAALGMLRGVEALRSSERAADHDALTGLRNRRGLDASFRRLVQDPDGVLLCLVDLDDFKAVNDTHGHEVGDELLRAVAAALVRAAGSGAVVARLGGDEFVVLLPGTPVPRAPGSPAGGAPGAERRRVHDEVPARLVAAVQQPLSVAGHELRGSASVGVVHVVAPSTLPQALTRADIALYETKAAGKAGVTTYRPRMRTQVQRRQRLAGDLRLVLEGAPAARVGALVVHHQPLVLLETGEVVGSEALVRWHHPHLGLLPPVDFLTVAHDMGRDVDVDAHVLDLALGQVGGWLRAGLDAVPVSVNVTPASLVEGGLDARVERLLRRHGVPSRMLRLEITEHEQVPASPQVVRELQALQRAGVRISLDDFGAGYTSLGYLQRFPVSLLKLDRSLVTSLEDDLGLLAGIAAMARALRLDVLAEGVETADQRALLVDLGIRYGQGHLFSPALAAEHMEALLHPLVPADAGAGVPAP